MPRSYWGIILAIVGLVSVYLLVGDLSSVSRQVQSEASDRADKYREDADRYIERRCIRLAFPAREDCTRQADQSARENQRVEFDLAAQRITAWWTQVMGVAALIGMALSAVGVWLVWVTFRETRLAAEHARATYEAFVAVEDANLTVEIFNCRAGREGGEKVWRFGLRIRNLGRAPAAIEVVTIYAQEEWADCVIGQGETKNVGSWHMPIMSEAISIAPCEVTYSTGLHDGISKRFTLSVRKQPGGKAQGFVSGGMIQIAGE
jgi:hypothetical protein